MTISDGTHADSSKIVDITDQQDQGYFRCCSNYQIKASRFENEFVIETDGDVLVGHVKLYSQGYTCSALIMNLNKEVIMAISVHYIYPNTAYFFTPSTCTEYACVGELHVETEAGHRMFTFKKKQQAGPPRGVINIEPLGSSRKFQLLSGMESCGCFSLNNKSIDISSGQASPPFEVPFLLGIAFSASQVLPFKD